MWDAIKAFSDGLTPEVQAALIGAFAVVGAATFGAIAVVLQIGRQARHAIEQNRHNETLKLKLKLYEEFVSVCRDAANADVELSSYIRKFQMEVTMFRSMAQLGRSWPIPATRTFDLLEMNSGLMQKTIEIISFAERWQIIDPRIELFRTAINVANHDIREAFQRYSQIACRLMPQEIPGHPQQGTLFPWHPPNDQSAQRLDEIGEELLNALMDLGSYIYDFQIEMQNLLLGELFKRKIPAREPIDPNVIVVRLDRFKELAAYFEKETAWGRHKAQTESEVHAAQSSSP